MFVLRNVTKNREIAGCPVLAKSFRSRLFGMIGRRFTDFDGMVFTGCSAVHTFFMSIPLDLIFTDAQNRIVLCKEAVVPWVPVVSARGACAVIELPVGAIRKSSSAPGDLINLEIDSIIPLEIFKNKSIFQEKASPGSGKTIMTECTQHEN